jgi:hypothetical protein
VARSRRQVPLASGGRPERGADLVSAAEHLPGLAGGPERRSDRRDLDVQLVQCYPHVRVQPAAGVLAEGIDEAEQYRDREAAARAADWAVGRAGGVQAIMDRFGEQGGVELGLPPRAARPRAAEFCP